MRKEFRLGSDPLSRLKGHKAALNKDSEDLKSAPESAEEQSAESSAVQKGLKGILAGSKQAELQEPKPVPEGKLPFVQHNSAEIIEGILNLLLCLPLKSLEHNPGQEVVQLVKGSRNSFRNLLRPCTEFLYKERLSADNVNSLFKLSLEGVLGSYGLDLNSFALSYNFDKNLFWQRERTVLICLGIYECLYCSFVLDGVPKQSRAELDLRGFTDARENIHLVCQSRGVIQWDMQSNFKSAASRDLLADIFVQHKGGMFWGFDGQLMQIRFIVPNRPMWGGLYE